MKTSGYAGGSVEAKRCWEKNSFWYN